MLAKKKKPRQEQKRLLCEFICEVQESGQTPVPSYLSINGHVVSPLFTVVLTASTTAPLEINAKSRRDCFVKFKKVASLGPDIDACPGRSQSF